MPSPPLLMVLLTRNRPSGDMRWLHCRYARLSDRSSHQYCKSRFRHTTEPSVAHWLHFASCAHRVPVSALPFSQGCRTSRRGNLMLLPADLRLALTLSRSRAFAPRVAFYHRCMVFQILFWRGANSPEVERSSPLCSGSDHSFAFHHLVAGVPGASVSCFYHSGKRLDLLVVVLASYRPRACTCTS